MPFVLILLLIIACLTLKGVALGIAIGILGGALLAIIGMIVWAILVFKFWG